jgi:hypothetical protein
MSAKGAQSNQKPEKLKADNGNAETRKTEKLTTESGKQTMEAENWKLSDI